MHLINILTFLFLFAKQGFTTTTGSLQFYLNTTNDIDSNNCSLNLTEIKFQLCENTNCEIIELISDSTKEFCYSVITGFN